MRQAQRVTKAWFDFYHVYVVNDAHATANDKYAFISSGWFIHKNVRSLILKSISFNAWAAIQTYNTWCPVSAEGGISFSNAGDMPSAIISTAGVFARAPSFAIMPGTVDYDDLELKIKAPGAEIVAAINIYAQRPFGFAPSVPITFEDRYATADIHFSWRLVLRGSYSFSE